jgi:hypothetical protein
LMAFEPDPVTGRASGNISTLPCLSWLFMIKAYHLEALAAQRSHLWVGSCLRRHCFTPSQPLSTTVLALATADQVTVVKGDVLALHRESPRDSLGKALIIGAGECMLVRVQCIAYLFAVLWLCYRV